MILATGYDAGVVLKLYIYQGTLIWNGTTFETFDATRKALYKTVVTEAAPGYYVANIPGGLPVGDFNGVFLEDATDIFVSGKPFEVKASTNDYSPSDDLILKLRRLVKDAADSNFIQDETPKMPGGKGPNGIGVIFRLQRTNIVPGTVFVTINDSFRQGSGFSVDTDKGVLTFDVAPPADADPFIAEYNFYWFADTMYSEFLQSAAENLGVDDPDQVAQGLVNCLLQYGAYHYYMARASEYAHKYASGAAGATQQIDTVTRNFQGLAKTALATADKMRDDFYKGQGRQNKAASGTVTYKIDPYFPKR